MRVFQKVCEIMELKYKFVLMGKKYMLVGKENDPLRHTSVSPETEDISLKNKKRR